MATLSVRILRLIGATLVAAVMTAGCAQLLGLKEDTPAAACVLNSDCPPSQLCIFRVCSAACKVDKDCELGSRCLDSNGSAACVQATNATCSDESDCPTGSVCDAAHTCRNSCENCHDDQTCIADVCVGTDAAHDPIADAGGSGGSGGSDGSAGSRSMGGDSGSANAGTPGDAGASSSDGCGDTPVGSTAPCNELPDGTQISFPGAKPQGICAAGTKLCKPDGTFDACTGAVAPGTADCASTEDNNCDGKPDNTQCGLCKLADTQYCYDGTTGTSGVGACKQGTQVCQLDASGKETVWGTCAGEVTPAPNDTCDTGNDATCNAKPNEGCACLNGQSASCGTTLGALGACAAGTTKCAGGNWGACSIAPKASDTCDDGNDATCNGKANESCGCINGKTKTCGTTGTGCTEGTRTCASGAYGGACAGNSCVDFAVAAPTDKCSANGPVGETVFNSCQIAVCSAGYHVTGCTPHASGNGTCSYDGAYGANPTYASVSVETNTKGGTVTCTFNSCTCRRDGF